MSTATAVRNEDQSEVERDERAIDASLQPDEIRVDTTKVNIIDIVEREKELVSDKKRAIDSLIKKKGILRNMHEAGKIDAAKAYDASVIEAEVIHEAEQAKLDSHLRSLGHTVAPEPEPLAPAAVPDRVRRKPVKSDTTVNATESPVKRKRGPMSEETKAKMKLAAKKRWSKAKRAAKAAAAK